MTLTIKDIEHFSIDNSQLLMNTFARQLKKQFNLLVATIPSLECIKWTSEQEDEMSFSLTACEIIKDNGYTLEYNRDSSNINIYSEQKKSIELIGFSFEDMELISAFQTYLDCVSRIMVNIFGSGSFILENDLILGDGSTFTKIKSFR